MRSRPGREAEMLVVLHAEHEGPGLLSPALEACGLEIRLVRTFAGEAVPRSADGAAGVVIMGGPMGVYESERHAHLRDEILLAGDALRRGLPILGICLGSQILAAAAGARVYAGAAKEIGWFPVTLTGAGRADPVLGVFPSGTVFFHWHGDTFDLPADAVLLASTSLYPHQAFRLGACAWGVQFHPEITPEMVDRFVEAGAPESVDFGGAEGGERMRVEARRHSPPLAGRIGAMVRGFCGAARLRAT
jgi:GMP synthase (glutamine-hydrolysing)